jgi:hypothetical protein
MYGSEDLRQTISTVNRTNTVIQLKMSSTAAPAKARRNSFLLAISAKETIRLVTEVPMLAPIMIGIAMPTVKTKLKMK